MTQQEYAGNQTINTKLIITLFAVMTLAFAFVAILTNTLVNSKVNALASAYQSNPVTVAAPVQTNAVPAAATCNAPVAQPDKSAATTSANTTTTTPTTSGGTYYMPWSGHSMMPATYNQSNSSVINTTSNNSYVNDSYNNNSKTSTRTKYVKVVKDNGNTYNLNSGNTYNANLNSNNTDNSTHHTNVDSNNETTIVTNNSNNNTNIQDNGNTTTVDSSSHDTNIALGLVAVAVAKQ